MLGVGLPDGRLTFSFSECEEELRALQGIVADYLAAQSTGVIPRFAESLRSIRGAPEGGFRRWEVHQTEPILTIPSEGEYSLGGTRDERRSICASIDGVWEIEPLGPNNPGSLTHRKFALGGLASARIRLIDSTTGEEMAMWRMELGDHMSPGCFFHVQIRGQNEEIPFPKSLDIPRLPSNVMLLPAAVEFAVAELFQERWAETAARETSHMKTWRPIQQRRLNRQLMWQNQMIMNGTGSPWTRLKRGRPPANLFDA